MKYLKNYFVIVGLLSHIVILVLLFKLFSYYELTPRQFVLRALEKVEIDNKTISALLEPSDLFPDYIPVTEFTFEGPRILPQVKKLLNGVLTPADFHDDVLNVYRPCSHSEILGNLSCWLFKRDKPSRQNLRKKLNDFIITLPTNNGTYGSGWELALTYDSVRTTDVLADYEKDIVERKLLRAIDHYLLLLNGNSASQWHGRATLAAQMWLCITALDKPPINLLQQVEPHFEQLLQAIELTPAWPEGYNYWINNRALHISLALGSYLTSANNTMLKRRVAKALEDVGYWHIYATRPDGNIEPIGDKGPRLDLKDETRRVIDILAQVTGNHDFANFSAYLESLHKAESYYRGYRWGFFLFNNPNLVPDKEVNSLATFNGVIPYSRIFGKGHYGLAFFRQNWSDNGTFINYKAGDTFTHHGHYDSGHFSIFKGKPLIVNSSEYGEYSGGNRLNYAIRTISKNSIIIQKPREVVKPNRFFKENVSDGGQRVLLPTGSSIQSVDDWYVKRASGKVLAGGEIKVFEDKGSFVFVHSDLTKAYNSTWHDENSDNGKVNLVQRSLVYLREEDALLIYDYVEPTSSSYKVKSLLHMHNRPDINNAKLLKGKEHNGIYRSDENTFKLSNGEAKLVGTVFHDGYLQFLGGYDYKFYVETDGDDTVLDGKNYSQGLSDKLYGDAANWRLEIVSNPAVEHNILTVLQPSLNSFQKTKPVYQKHDGGVTVSLEDKLVLLWSDKKEIRLDNINGINKVIIVGLNKDQTYYLKTKDKMEKISSVNSLELELVFNSDYLELTLEE